MKRRNFLKVLVGSSILLNTNIASAVTTQKKLIFVAWDGVGKETLNRVINKGLAPNINNFILNNGLYNMELVTRSLTAPSFATIFTGLDSYQHGVWGNKNKDSELVFFDKLTLTEYNKNNNQYGKVNWWSGQLQLPQLLTKTLRDNGVFTGWITCKKYLSKSSWFSPFRWALNNSVDKFSFHDIDVEGESYITKIETDTLTFMNAFRNNPHFIFSHTNPDAIAHEYSENSNEYELEIHKSDMIFGNILREKDSDTKIMVLTDHGFDMGTKTHNNAYDAWFTTNLPVNTKWINGGATNRDVTPTILEWWGHNWKGYFRKGKSLL